MNHDIIGKEVVLILSLLSFIVLWEHTNWGSYIPSSAVATIVGMLTSLGLRTNQNPSFTFPSEIFLYLLLPPILLHSALQFRISSLRRTWISSITFAWIGTVCSTVMIAWGVMVWTRHSGVSMTFIDALIFSSILAPTDTVATLSLSKSLPLQDTFISEVLENESVMNDALSIVLLHLFQTMSNKNQQIDKWVPIHAIMFSILYTCLASFVGIMMAKYITWLNVRKTSMHYILALQLYATCEFFGLSGIICLFVYGSMIRAPQDMHTSMKSLTTIIEAYVYLMLGLAFHSYETTHAWLSFGVLISCVVARICVVFVLGFFLRCCAREKKWSVRSLLFVSLCGIRGAISFALGSSLTEEWSAFAKSSIFVVIVSTIIFMGAFQRCMYILLLAPDTKRTIRAINSEV